MADVADHADQVALGFALPQSGSWATPATIARFAKAAEGAGYESLWTFQRLLYPVDGQWGEMYRQVHDPLMTLAHVAALTTRPRLGVAVLNMPYYSPVVLSKQLTTLDALSDGRLDVGLGIGWAPEELETVGVPMSERGARAEEFVRCLKTIWDDDPAEFSGTFYRVPRSHVLPRPVQRPHPPLLLGATADAALTRVGRLADGWISASRQDLRKVGRAIGIIRAAAKEAGRDADRLRFVIRGVAYLDEERTGRDGSRRLLSGSAEQIRQDLSTLAAEGVTEVFLDPNFDTAVSGPDVDATEAERRAMRLLETFAPAGI
ncbi:MAG TPA: TIGR03619 family F420-dependent LLM class oxidoreductase [Actinomycetales bacterium]|nr:TIGR03619 family F420-dependent LLM class oxidoreductase [Actinomycetales bacterium]